MMNSTEQRDLSGLFENSTQPWITVYPPLNSVHGGRLPVNNDLTSYHFYTLLVLSTLGLVGNFLALVVILKNTFKSLNIVIACMLISDTFYIIFRVINNFDFWDLKIPYQGILGISGGCAAVIGIERSLAITKPLWFRRKWTVIKTASIIAVIVTVNVFTDVLHQMLSKDFEERYRLNINIAHQIIARYLPCVIVTGSNILISVQLSKYARNMANLSAENKTEIRQTCTVFPLIVIYIISTIPDVVLLLQRAGLVPVNDLNGFRTVTRYLTLFNASVNFYMYVLVHNDLRKKFLSIFCNCCNNER